MALPPVSLQSSQNNRPHGVRLQRGIAIPSNMISPGQEGYRTPTIEDYEKQLGHASQNEHGRGGFTSSLSHLHIHLPKVLEPLSSPRSVNFILRDGLEKLAWKQRIRHFTWTFFTITMATGGIANVIYAVPFRFTGLDAVGTIFFLLNIVLFILNVVLISIRFYCFPNTFKASFLHPTESLFAPAAVVSFGTILINVSEYGLPNVGPWLDKTVLALFWVDATFAIGASCGIYLIMWSTQTFTIAQMTPVWIFPAYPLLIIGPHAGVLSGVLDPEDALDIIIGGFTIQGIGYLVSIMIYSAFIYRLMTQKLPKESLRPGMFVSVGPSGFTAAGIITMASNAAKAVPPDFMGNGELAAIILKVLANWLGLWFWGLAIWFFMVSAGAHISCIESGGLTFAMTWYSFIFPNTALITATFAVGKAFGSHVIQIIGCVLTCLLVVAWIFVSIMMIRAVVLKQILWPQKGEDRDEGGFTFPPDTENRSRSRSRSFQFKRGRGSTTIVV